MSELEVFLSESPSQAAVDSALKAHYRALNSFVQSCLKVSHSLRVLFSTFVSGFFVFGVAGN